MQLPPGFLYDLLHNPRQLYELQIGISKTLVFCGPQQNNHEVLLWETTKKSKLTLTAHPWLLPVTKPQWWSQPRQNLLITVTGIYILTQKCSPKLRFLSSLTGPVDKIPWDSPFFQLIFPISSKQMSATFLWEYPLPANILLKFQASARIWGLSFFF